MIVFELLLALYDDILFKIFALSCKKIFFISLLFFWSTIKVTPLNESENC